MSAEFTKKEIKEIKKCREKLPKSLEVEISIAEDNRLVAEVSNFEGCYTQADSFGELIYMVNDAVYTVVEVPEKYYSEMPSYIPPVELARALNVFPKKEKDISSPIKFSLKGV